MNENQRTRSLDWQDPLGARGSSADLKFPSATIRDRKPLHTIGFSSTCQSRNALSRRIIRPTSNPNPNADQPLALAKQGSFFINEQNIATAFPDGEGTQAPGHISVKGMYVQYQIPHARIPGRYPVIMVLGSVIPAKRTRRRQTDGWDGPNTLCDAAFRSM
jgi:hypothetical protein